MMFVSRLFCTVFVSYLRGLKDLRFDGMTLSYRLKYLTLGSMLGLVMPFIVHFIMQENDMNLFNRIRSLTPATRRFTDRRFNEISEMLDLIQEETVAIRK